MKFFFMSPILHNCRVATPRSVLFALLVGMAALDVGTTFRPVFAAGALRTNEASRYLIMVETSSSMSRYAANAQKLAGELLLSAMNGELRSGDTIGVWTFNDELSAGSFPLQVWTPQARQRIAAGVVEFLQRQRYEKQTQLDKALAPMMRVVKDSEKITVLLISDGNNKVSGTPFDGEINDTFSLNYSTQRKLHMPFITVLRARKGEFIGGKVSVPPWPVEFPEFAAEPLAAEPKVTETPRAKEGPKPQLTVTSTVPSLIVTGKKREPAPSSPTNAAPTEAAKPEPTSAATTAAATNPIAKSPEPVVPPPIQPAASSTAAITTTTQQHVTVVPSARTKSEIPPLPKTETTSSAIPLIVVPSDKPKAQAAPEISPKPAEPVVQTAVATPTETILSRTGVLIAAVVLLLMAVGLVYALMRRSRTAAPESLITRSMDRDRK